MSTAKKWMLNRILILGTILLFVVILRAWNANALEEKLFGAACDGDTATVERLFNQGVDIDGKNLEWHNQDTPLTAAVRNGHTDTVRFLLNHHVNTRGALRKAITRNNPDIVRLLKEAGAID